MPQVIRKSLQDLKQALAAPRGSLSMVPEEAANLTIYDIQQKSKLEISATSLLSGFCEPVSLETQLAD